MTFNEGIQIDTSTASSSGGPGRGLAIGGGLGGLVIVVVALLLGVDPGTITTAPQPGQQQQQVGGFDVSQCKTGEDANNILGCRIIATGNSVDAVWSELMGSRYTRPNVVLFSGAVNTGCGSATTDVGPFYCPADQTAYFDTSFFDILVEQFGSSGGKLAQEYVVAHEYGHHVQNLLGVLGRAQSGAQGAAGAGVRTELQADCYAGVWAHYASTVKQQSTGVPFLKPLTDKDIQDALQAAASVGDDWIQRQSGRRVDPDLFTHGTSEQRQHWFTVGYQLGEPKRCDTFSATNLG